MAPTKTSGKKAPTSTAQTFIVDFSGPANDRLFDGDAYQKFLVDRIKVGGKTGQLGEDVKVETKEGKLIITSSIPFSKRYLKYLTKKFLKKSLIREWLRVVSTSKNTYTLRFYNVAFDDDKAES